MRIPHITLLLATVCLATGTDWHKRAPSGFTGVRGKKSIPDDEYAPAADKRMSARLFGVAAAEPKTFDGWTAAEKRGPASGFLGVRGKKDAEDEFDKRAPSGFLGMRGKKDELLDADGDIKRAPAAGFFGVRGKKQPARSGFFGMRGKKYPYEFRGKFVGVRGKKASEEAGRDYGDMLQQVGQQLDINQLMLLLTENAPYNNPENYPIFNTINN